MSNDYYDHQNYPSQGSAGSSSALRAELDSIEAGFEKLPVLAGNDNKLVVVNGSGTALESIPGSSFTGIALANTIGTLALNRGGTGQTSAPAAGIAALGYTPEPSFTVLPISKGGTGATSAAAALTALGASASTLVSTGNVLGAVNLANPGGTTRSLTQWDGVAYTNVILNSPGGYQAPRYSLGLANCNIAADIGTGRPGFLFDTGDYIDYNRLTDSLSVVIGNVEKAVFNSSYADFRVESVTQIFSGPCYKYTFNQAAPVNQKRSLELIDGSTITRSLIDDSFSQDNIFDTVTRSGANVTTRRLNQTSGRLLVGQGVTDDGVTALQTTSYSASNQPSLVGGTGLNIVATPFTYVELTFGGILKGGMAINETSKKITVPVAGVYLVTASVQFSPGNSKGKAFLAVFKNDAPQYNEMVEVVTVNTAYSIPFSMQVSMLPNDYLTLGIYNEPITNVNAQSRIQHLSVTKIN